jgi:hypothetical protein
VKVVDAPGGKTDDELLDAPPPAGVSILDSKADMDTVPISWDLSRDGKMLLGLVQYPQINITAVARWHLNAAGADKPRPIAKTTLSLIAYLASGPSGDEALVASLRDYKKGLLADDIWRTAGVDPGMPSGNAMPQVKYLDQVKLPGSMPPTALERIPAFYSWDGKLVVLPVEECGVVVADPTAGTARFAPFPATPGWRPTHMSVGVLPDQNGKRLVYAGLDSFDTGQESSQVQVLDLDSLQWIQQQDFDWVVYQMACDDVEHKPWVLLGTRTKKAVSEPARVPRLALFHPGQQGVQELPLYGDVVWSNSHDFRVDPHGQYVVYMDRRRKGLVRLEPATGKLDLDPRWYTRKAQLLMDEHASTVLLVQDNTVMQADWSKHEEVPGYASDASSASGGAPPPANPAGQ